MPGKMEPLPGTTDIWSPETAAWVDIETTARAVFGRYAYGELRTPIFERTDLFVRGLGDQTEVVQKEMYSFVDRGGRNLTLRPEGTAGVMRAIANQGLAEGTEKRVFYLGPMFRGERPAAGRKRQFHQIGVEAVGRVSPAMDAESIAMLIDFLAEIGVGKTRLLINSKGAAADRQAVDAALKAYFARHIDHMCEDCRRRLDGNVWRILDCKAEPCQAPVAAAPAIVDLLGPASQAYFESVLSLLDKLEVPYERAPRLVRGLDYYEHTVFEVLCDGEHLGAQNAIAGGGRYSICLPGVKQPVVGVGFAAGVERLLLAKGLVDLPPASQSEVDVYVAALGEALVPGGMQIARQLRQAGLRVMAETEGRSLKAQLRTADRVAANLVAILGDQENDRGVILCRSMDSSQQVELPQAGLLDFVRTKLNNQPIASAARTA